MRWFVIIKKKQLSDDIQKLANNMLSLYYEGMEKDGMLNGRIDVVNKKVDDVSYITNELQKKEVIIKTLSNKIDGLEKEIDEIKNNMNLKSILRNFFKQNRS